MICQLGTYSFLGHAASVLRRRAIFCSRGAAPGSMLKRSLRSSCLDVVGPCIWSRPPIHVSSTHVATCFSPLAPTSSRVSRCSPPACAAVWDSLISLQDLECDRAEFRSESLSLIPEATVPKLNSMACPPLEQQRQRSINVRFGDSAVPLRNILCAGASRPWHEQHER